MEKNNLKLLILSVFTCSFWIGDTADRQKMQKEEEKRQFSFWTLHVGCGTKPALDNRSNTTEMRSR